jgi:hypothetical protein
MNSISMFTNASRALQCYLVLIGCAARRETATYIWLAEKLGYSGGQHIMGDRFGPLMFWCKQNDLPALTGIVVRENTRIPGLGIYLDPSALRPATAIPMPPK